MISDELQLIGHDFCLGWHFQNRSGPLLLLLQHNQRGFNAGYFRENVLPHLKKWLLQHKTLKRENKMNRPDKNKTYRLNMWEILNDGEKKRDVVAFAFFVSSSNAASLQHNSYFFVFINPHQISQQKHSTIVIIIFLFWSQMLASNWFGHYLPSPGLQFFLVLDLFWFLCACNITNPQVSFRDPDSVPSHKGEQKHGPQSFYRHSDSETPACLIRETWSPSSWGGGHYFPFFTLSHI